MLKLAVSCLCPLFLLAVGCGGSGTDDSDESPSSIATPSALPTGSTPTVPSPDDAGVVGSQPPVPVSPGKGDAAVATTPACGAMPNVLADVVRPQFKFVDRLKGILPPQMTGGSLQGRYVVRAATVYLPEAAALVARLDTSRGTVKAGFAFVGRGFRLQMSGDITVDSLIGPQTRATTLDGEGTFSSQNAKFVAETTCGAVPQIQGEITYTARANGATFLLKTTELQQDVFIELEAEVVQ